MAAHGENSWPPPWRFRGRRWGDSHGRRHPCVSEAMMFDAGGKACALKPSQPEAITQENGELEEHRMVRLAEAAAMLTGSRSV
jgi:hypothetical protein